MRLTLRTMLAYLDDILEPADAQQLSAKIEESDFAGGLVHRIRGSMRRLRLAAPKLEGNGMGLDCNTVAEYLDNTLPSDRVPDFEKVCLESEVHLAEVASCHQILTLVLGEPADISPEIRQRIYRIDTATEEQEQEQAAAESPAEEPEPPPQQSPSQQLEPVVRAKAEVADYLRAASRRRMWPLALTTVLVFLLAAATLLVIWPPAGGTLLSLLFSPSDGRQAASEPSADQQPSRDAEEDQPSEAGNVNAAEEHAVEDNMEQPPTTEEQPRQDIPAPEPAHDTDQPLQSKTPEPPEPLNNAAGDVAKPAPAPRVNEPEDKPPAVVSHYISSAEVLIRLNEKENTWTRLPDRAPLVPGDRLLVLPTYHPQIMLTSDIQLTLGGGTLLRLEPPEADGTPHIHLVHGQAVIATVGQSVVKIAMTLGRRRGIATLGDTDSILEVHVQPIHVQGANPEKNQAPTIVRVFAASGNVDWQQQGQAVVLSAGQVHELLDDAPGKTTTPESMPKWTELTDVNTIYHLASVPLKLLLDHQRPISLSLQELATHRRVEVRSLAIHCLTQLDQFEHSIDLLKNPSLKSYWSSHFDSLQAALARSPESAAGLRKALENLRGEDAPLLYEMLWGYSPAGLKAGGSAKLVSYLSQESLDFRVLAMENLRRITGKTLFYHAYKSPAKQKGPIGRWLTAEKKGEIVCKTPPTFVPAENQPAAPAPAPPGDEL